LFATLERRRANREFSAAFTRSEPGISPQLGTGNRQRLWPLFQRARSDLRRPSRSVVTPPLCSGSTGGSAALETRPVGTDLRVADELLPFKGKSVPHTTVRVRHGITSRIPRRRGSLLISQRQGPAGRRERVDASLIWCPGKTLANLTRLPTSYPPMPPKVNKKRAQFVLTKISEILALERQFRSRRDDDSEQDLVSLCARCHS
jgi:hypothetical protein